MPPSQTPRSAKARGPAGARPATTHLSVDPDAAVSGSDPGWCSPRALWGWSPSPLPSDTPSKRLVDRFLPSTGLPFIGYFAALVTALGVAPLLPRRGELALDGVVALAAGAWCALNYWRCRHAHCLVSGVGWLALSLLALVEAGLGRSVIGGDEQLVFLGVLVLAVLFEAGWYATHGTNAITVGTRRKAA